MRLGMSGAFLPNNMDDFTPEMAKKIRNSELDVIMKQTSNLEVGLAND